MNDVHILILCLWIMLADYKTRYADLNIPSFQKTVVTICQRLSSPGVPSHLVYLSVIDFPPSVDPSRPDAAHIRYGALNHVSSPGT